MTYWAMKSEPETYSIFDLQSESPAIWEGCRNYQVRNWMRDVMQVGDLALFCNSNSKPSGPAGVMRVVGAAVADPTQFDPKSDYYDAKATRESPRWVAPTVEFVCAFPAVVPIGDLKTMPELEGMFYLKKGLMFSVVPIEQREFEFVVDLAGVNMKELG
ncbi:MAG: EVE domain-containing protein [Fimbriimonadaceae bacterium]